MENRVNQSRGDAILSLPVCEFLTIVAFILLWSSESFNLWKWGSETCTALVTFLRLSTSPPCFPQVEFFFFFFGKPEFKLSSETPLFFICPLNAMSYFRNSLRKHLCKFYESMFHIKSFTSKPPKTNNNLFRLLVFFGSRSPRLVAWDAPLVHQEPFDKPIVLRVLRSLTLKT